MAAIRNVFEDAVRSAADEVRKEYPGNSAAEKISKQFQGLAEACLKRNLEVGTRKYQYELVHIWPMVERQLWNLRKLILKRMKPTANIREPWTISFSCGVPLEVFKLIQMVLKEGIEGAVCEFEETKARWTVKIKSIETLKELFSLARSVRRRTLPSDNDTNLLKDFNNLGHAQLIIGEGRDCILNYSRTLEVLRIRCHYGFWNSYGFPQHFVGNL